MKTVSEGVTINDTLFHIIQEDLSLCGLKKNGMGQYYGQTGFDTFTKYKSIYFQTRYKGLKFMRPPFKKLTNAWIKLIMR